MKLTTSAVEGRAPSRRKPTPRDLVGSAELPNLLLQLSYALLVLGRHSRALTIVDLGLLDPVTQGLRAESELDGDPGHHAVTLAGLLHGLLDHADRSLPQLRRMLVSRSMLRRL